MKNYTKYLMSAIVIAVLGILYSCERQGSNIEIKDTYESVAVTDKDLEDAMQTEAVDATKNTVNTICIHVAGSVVTPGVYELPEGSRVYEAIMLAGGFSEEADMDYINQAAVLNDGQRLYIYSVKEASTAGDYFDKDNQIKEPTLVNINTASKEKLMTLPGIGESRAESIITYREEYGRFKTIEDIMKVSGIKDAAYSKLKNYICVD